MHRWLQLGTLALALGSPAWATGESADTGVVVIPLDTESTIDTAIPSTGSTAAQLASENGGAPDCSCGSPAAPAAALALLPALVLVRRRRRSLD